MVYDQLGRLDAIQHYGPDAFGGDPNTLADNPLLAEFDYTLRADGKRTNEAVTGPYGLIGSYVWHYDDAGRLTSESFDHAWDNAKDYTTEYTFDLAGNRLEKTVDQGSNSSIDKRYTYEYDAADRLLEETLDSLTGQDNRTVYEWGSNGSATYQTRKTVFNTWEGSPAQEIERTNYSYDLRGRMSQAQKFASSQRDTTTYEYADNGIRVSAEQTVETSDGNGGWQTPHLQVETSYLNDPTNPTGYSQVLLETRTDEITGQKTQVGYVIGHDLIAQSTAAWNEGTQSFDTPTVITFVYDGHGTTRTWTDPSGNLSYFASDAILLYDAYGLPVNFNAANSPTNYLYSGEQWDQRVEMQYLRARLLSSNLGIFSSLDPHEGFKDHPGSLNKYAYVSGDPINKIDPTGLFEGLSGFLATQGSIQAESKQNNAAVFAAGRQAIGAFFNKIGAQTQQLVGQIISHTLPKAQVLTNRAVSSLSRSNIDFVIKTAGKKIFLEVKYRLPNIAGSALTRLVNQVNAMAAARNGQMVVWTLVKPGPAQLKLLEKAVGPAVFSRLTVLSGVESLYSFLLLL